MNPGNKVLRLFALGGIAATLLAGCGGSTASPGSAGKISLTIGEPNSMTGSIATIGLEQRRAEDLAAADINSTSKDIAIQMVPVDDQSTVPGAAAAVQSLVSNSSVNVVVGMSFTQLCESVSPILAQNSTPTIFLQCSVIGSGAAGSVRPNNAFGMAADSAAAIQTLIDKALKANSVKTLGLISQDQASLNTGVAQIKAASSKDGIQVVDHEVAAVSETDFGTQITKVLASKPDAIGAWGASPQVDATIISKLKARGYKGVLMTTGAATNSAFFQVAGPAAEGVYIYSQWDAGTANQEAKRFLTMFGQKYPGAPTPDYLALQGWDAVHIMADAVRRAGTATDHGKINKALASGTYAGALDTKLQFGKDATQPTVFGFITLNGYAEMLHSDGSVTAVK